ncbi:outer membrane protein assembly factor BamB family protein [Micromonospora foliorum]|uniref:outer membrane protein assembly factor BamB family protein n=1 Tax=Micromonospora foliorum TaxID=2911210 RepID=UPI001EE7E92A|nr:PQQ-binding-like beta-propeller repeat protein [Micromonospora foliorum]MCG5440336.1 PQQ-binding-like beta-propeller repeat protein [Micromonospora foliorum]
MRHAVKVLTAAAVLAATVAIPATPAVAGGTGWWSMSGYLVSNSAFNPNETSVTVPTVANLKLKHTGTPARTGQRAPVVADGLVYAVDDLGVTATDEVTGAQKWRFELDPEKFLMPTELVHTAGQLVFAANVILHSPGAVASQVFVLDAPTGTVVRDFPDDGVATQILVDRGVVMVSGESRWAADTRAYRLADGQLLWQHDKYMQQPVSANGRVILSGTGTSAKPLASVIVDITTGTISHTTADRDYRALATDEAGTKFYVGWGHSLQVLDATTGTLTWLASNLSPKFVVVTPTRLYVTSFGGTVFALNRSTGAIIWSKSIPGSEHQRAIIAGGVLHVTAKGNRVYALNPVDGAPLNAPAFTGATDQLVVTYGRVYVTDGTKLAVYGL